MLDPGTRELGHQMISSYCLLFPNFRLMGKRKKINTLIPISVLLFGFVVFSPQVKGEVSRLF